MPLRISWTDAKKNKTEFNEWMVRGDRWIPCFSV